MTLKGIMDRKLFMLVGSLVLKRCGTALAVYLASKGAPADQLDQLLTALAAVVGIGSDLLFDYVEKKRAEYNGARKMLDAIGRTDTDADWVAR
ncbi:hypothetical protein [Agrobacterium larrymoorei]|uniref:Uncharacterized protein n=1 Tax=Agrobacterium larrymoorei TaxID=160699 RepID=A0AAF0H488_9HYPH|nr:hypothetical protein [Agrobacterium larrymoorei]WHA39889.1 hypothetical protein CFBP5477_008475 [Agrobacterium larrymoorei]